MYSRLLSKSFAISNSVVTFSFSLSYLDLFLPCQAIGKWVVMRCIKSGYRKLTRPLLCIWFLLSLSVSPSISPSISPFVSVSSVRIFPVSYCYSKCHFMNLYLLFKPFPSKSESQKLKKWKQGRKIKMGIAAVRVATFFHFISAHIKGLFLNYTGLVCSLFGSMRHSSRVHQFSMNRNTNCVFRSHKIIISNHCWVNYRLFELWRTFGARRMSIFCTGWKDCILNAKWLHCTPHNNLKIATSIILLLSRF